MFIIVFLLQILPIAFLAALSFYNFYYKRRHYPPGPIPLPLFGNLISIALSGTGELAFKRWAHQYGPIYTYWIGELPVICVAEYEKMVQIFQKNAENYSDRYCYPVQKVVNEGKAAFGILLSNGERWHQHRRFALSVLRTFGLGKNLMQEKILDELSRMFDKIDHQKGGEIDLLKSIDISLASIINKLIFGYNFEGEREADYWELKNLLDEHSADHGGYSLLWMYILWPHLVGNLPFFKQKRLKFEERIAGFHRYFGRQIRERREKMEEEEEDRDGRPSSDYVEAFLREKARREAEGMEDGGREGEEGEEEEEEEGGSGAGFSMYQLGMMCFDLWITGQETMSAALCWGIAFLINNDKVVERMCEEIDRIAAESPSTAGKMITVAERSQLPYTNAVTNEILRCANISTQNFLRVVKRDVQLDNGLLLRKGTCILPQISAVLCDERIFPDPEQFNPDRFLDENGKLKRCDPLIPFSTGKRQCMGESLARMELFLFIANIFYRYNVKPVGKNRPSLKRVPGAIVHCAPFKCRMAKRY